MASISFIYHFVFFSFWYLNGLCVYGAPPQPAFKPASLTGSAGGSQLGLKVRYRGSSCSPSGGGSWCLNPLINDRARAESFYSKSKQSNTNYFTSDLKKEIHTKTSRIKNLPVKAGFFTVSIGFGTRNQNVDLLLDTGSDITWVECRKCSTCPKDGHSFDPFASSTFSNTSCNPPSKQFRIDYQDKTFSQGYYGCDNLTLSPTNSYSNFLFGCGHQYPKSKDGTYGVLGLTPDGSAIKTFGKIFGYCLPSKKGTQGYLHFGQEASQICTVDKHISLSIDPSFGYYKVSLTAISVDGNRIQISSVASSSPKAVIDSGTIITRLPLSVYSQLRSYFNKSMSIYAPVKLGDHILDTCYNLKGYEDWKIPTVVLHFENSVDLVLDKDSTLYPKGGNVFCLAFAAGDPTILGSQQQLKLNILYDTQNMKLGFGKGNCGN